jgi:hypothetical protein
MTANYVYYVGVRDLTAIEADRAWSKSSGHRDRREDDSGTCVDVVTANASVGTLI